VGVLAHCPIEDSPHPACTSCLTGPPQLVLPAPSQALPGDSTKSWPLTSPTESSPPQNVQGQRNVTIVASVETSGGYFSTWASVDEIPELPEELPEEASPLEPVKGWRNAPPGPAEGSRIPFND
jgi:hypothetical protein